MWRNSGFSQSDGMSKVQLKVARIFPWEFPRVSRLEIDYFRERQAKPYKHGRCEMRAANVVRGDPAKGSHADHQNNEAALAGAARTKKLHSEVYRKLNIIISILK
jgi:hypothetical protein